MPVKENQPTLRADIERLLQQGRKRSNAPGLRSPRVQVVGDAAQWPPVQTAQTSEAGHGRIERRVIEVLEVPASVDWLQWPGRRQVFAVRREVRRKAAPSQSRSQQPEKRRVEVCYGITSLSAEQAGPEQLLGLLRGHWSIENRSHWVRDVTFEEDRSLVRCGHVPQVMAALRNAVIGLMRCAGKTNLAAAGRYYAAQPREALALLGVLPTFK